MLARKMVTHIYDLHVQLIDRIFIYEYYKDLNAICKMVRKEKQAQIVRK